jgi:hypothetical protein
VCSYSTTLSFSVRDLVQCAVGGSNVGILSACVLYTNDSVVKALSVLVSLGSFKVRGEW